MSLKNFIPTIWDAQILAERDKAFLFAGLSNRSYEGQIRQAGDRVKINSIIKGSARQYTGATLTYDNPVDDSLFLDIDQKYYSGKQINNIDEAQASPKTRGEIARMMGVEIADNIDQYIASKYADAGIVSGTTGAPASITSANVISTFGSIEVLMDDNNVPMNGRVAVVPPWLAQKLRLAKIVRDTSNSSILANSSSFVGEVGGISVFKSNNISHSGATWYAPMFFVAGDTIAFAEQQMESEALKDKDDLADYMRAYVVYGAKVLRPSELAVLYCSQGSESAI